MKLKIARSTRKLRRKMAVAGFVCCAAIGVSQAYSLQVKEASSAREASPWQEAAPVKVAATQRPMEEIIVTAPRPAVLQGFDSFIGSEAGRFSAILVLRADLLSEADAAAAEQSPYDAAIEQIKVSAREDLDRALLRPVTPIALLAVVP